MKWVKRWILIVFILAGLVPAISCGEEERMAPSIEVVKQQNEARLMAMPGVVSVGVGQNKNGEPAIVVGLSGPNPETEEEIPRMIEGYPVDIRIVGSIRAE